jgi:tetratricopeptide (TPR) repeat protein
MKRVRVRRLLPLLLLATFLPLPALPAGNEGYEQMAFGVRAAKKGLWREALFRWERAVKLLPDNPRLLNNLAVAYETAGDFGKAGEMYEQALRLAPENRDIRQNHQLFSAYYKELVARQEQEKGREPPPSPPPAPEEKRSDASPE